MTISETAQLLAMCALIDSRKVDEQTIAIWQDLLGGLTFGECKKAALAYYKENREMIMPSDIYQVAHDDRIQWLMRHPNAGPQHPDIVPPWEQKSIDGPA